MMTTVIAVKTHKIKSQLSTLASSAKKSSELSAMRKIIVGKKMPPKGAGPRRAVGHRVGLQ